MTSTKQVLAGLAVGAALMGLGLFLMSRPVSAYEVNWLWIFGLLVLAAGLSIVGGICLYLAWYVAGGAMKEAWQDTQQRKVPILVLAPDDSQCATLRY